MRKLKRVQLIQSRLEVLTTGLLVRLLLVRLENSKLLLNLLRRQEVLRLQAQDVPVLRIYVHVRYVRKHVLQKPHVSVQKALVHEVVSLAVVVCVQKLLRWTEH